MVNNPVIVRPDDDEVFKLLHEGNKLLTLQEDERITFEADRFCDLTYLMVCFKSIVKALTLLV